MCNKEDFAACQTWRELQEKALSKQAGSGEVQHAGSTEDADLDDNARSHGTVSNVVKPKVEASVMEAPLGDVRPKPTGLRFTLQRTLSKFGRADSVALGQDDGSLSSADTPEGEPRGWAASIRYQWEQFTFFGVNRQDQTPRVWGQRVKSMERSDKVHPEAESSQLMKMVRQHQHQQEMRLQLRDSRIQLHYLDAFGMDTQPSRFLIRVFSHGATLLEYLKLILAVWAFFVSLAIAAFGEVNDLREVWETDMMLDAVYAICLVMQLRTTELEVKQGKEICRPRRILYRHISDLFFWVDVLSCVPLLVVHALVPKKNVVRWIAFGKALRGWRIFRLPPKHRFMPSMKFLLVRLFVALFMGGHFLACIWFILVHEEDTKKDHVDTERRENHWEECMGQTPSTSCFYTLYSLSLNTGVYLLMGIDRDAHSALEHFYLTICMPVGSLVHAYVLGEVILSLQRRGALETRRNEHTMAIREAMRILGLPPCLQVRIITYSTYETLHRSGRLFHALFTDLSPQLRFELQLHMYLDLVAQSGLFRDMRPRVIREIIVNLQDLIFLPGDWVCRYGDYGDSMYFIVRGVCTVIGKDTVTELKMLERGQYFGEVALLTGVPRTAYVRAGTFCILAHLTKDGFQPILQKWPDEVDVLLRGVEVEADRQKIKEEATRLYGLVPRRVSVSSNAASTHGGADTRRISATLPEVTPAPMRILCTEPSEEASSAVPTTWRKSKTVGDEAFGGRWGTLSPVGVAPDIRRSDASTSQEQDGLAPRSSQTALLSPGIPSTPKAVELLHPSGGFKTLRGNVSSGPGPNKVPPNSTRTSVSAPLFEEADLASHNEAIAVAEEQLSDVSSTLDQLANDVAEQSRFVSESLTAFRLAVLEHVREVLANEAGARRSSVTSIASMSQSDGLGIVI